MGLNPHFNLNSLASLSPSDRARFIDSLTDAESLALLYEWSFWARPEQLPPEGEWKTWLIMAGRGFGKTRTGAEWVRSQVEAGCRRVALVAPTASDARDVMVEGESGLLSVHMPIGRPIYEPSKRRLTWPNGAIATTYSAEDPDQLRGPQHDAAWCDELAAWTYPQETWDMLQFGLRLGQNPRQIITTTPRPIALIKELVKRDDVTVTRGSTLDNKANLAPSYVKEILARYDGTRLGRQEIYAEVLDDYGEVFKPSWIRKIKDMPDIKTLSIYMGSDYAVTLGGGDYTVHAVLGVDHAKKMYLLDIWRRQETSDQWVKAWCDLVLKYKPYACAEESGQIKSGVGPFRDAEARRRGAYTRIELFPTRGSKEVRAQSMIGRMAMDGLHVPANAPWLAAFEDELYSFTGTKADKHDDQVDAIGLLGQLLDKMVGGLRGNDESVKTVKDGYRLVHNPQRSDNDWVTF